MSSKFVMQIAAATAKLAELEQPRKEAQEAKREAHVILNAAMAQQDTAIKVVESLGGKVTYWELTYNVRAVDRRATQHAENDNRALSLKLRYADPAAAQLPWSLYNAYWNLGQAVDNVRNAREQLKPLVEDYQFIDGWYQTEKKKLAELQQQAQEARRYGGAYGERKQTVSTPPTLKHAATATPRAAGGPLFEAVAKSA